MSCRRVCTRVSSRGLYVERKVLVPRRKLRIFDLRQSPLQTKKAPAFRAQPGAMGQPACDVRDRPHSPTTLKKRILRTVLQEVIADTDDPPSVRKLHGAEGSHTELTVRKQPDGLSQTHQLGGSNRVDS